MADSASVLTSKISEKGKLTNSINRTTSESLRLNDSEKVVNSPNSLSSTAPRKKTSFQITSVIVGSRTSNDGGDDSADDLDESHAEDISEVLDNSRITDLENETPSYSEDTFSKDDVFFNASSSLVSAPVIPTSSQYGLAIVATPENSESALNPPDSSGNSDTVDTTGGDVTESVINLGVVSTKHDPEMRDMHPPAPRTERFKVVKIESTEPFKRGRWVCMDYLDHNIAQKEQSQVSSAKIESSECNIQVSLSTDISNSAPSDYTSSVNSVIEVSPLESQVPVPTEHINNCAPLNMQPNDSQVSSQMPISSVPSTVPTSYPSVSPGQSLQNSMQMGHIINSSAPPSQVSQQSQSLSQVNIQQILGNTSQHQSLQSQQMQQILSGANVMPMQQQQAPIPQTMQQQQPVMQQPMQTMQQMHQTNQQYQPQQQTMPPQQNIQQQQTMPQQQAPMPQQQTIQPSIPQQQQTIPQQQSLPQQQTLPQQAAVSQSQPSLTQQPSMTQQQALQQQAMQQTLPPQQQTMPQQQQSMSQQQPLPQQQSIPPQSQTMPQQQQPIPQQPQGIPQQQTIPQPQQQQTMPQQQQTLPQQQQQQQTMPQQQQTMPQQQQTMPQQQQTMPQQQQTMPQQQQTMPQQQMPQQQSMPQQQQSLPPQQQSMPQQQQQNMAQQQQTIPQQQTMPQQQAMAQQQQPMTQQQQTMPQQQPIPQQQFQTLQQPQQPMMQQMPQQTLQTQMPVQQVQMQPGVQQMPIQQPQNQQQQMMQQSLQQMQQQPSQMHQVPYSQAMQQTQQPVMTQAGQQQVPGMLPQMHPQMGYQTNQMMSGMQPQPIMNIQSQPHLQPQYYQTTQQMPTGIITSQPGMMTQGGMTQVTMQGSTPNLPPLQTYPTASVPQPMQVQGMPQTPPIPTSVQYTMPHLSQTNQPLSIPMSMQQQMSMPQPQPTPQQQPPLQQPPQPAQSYAGVSSPAQSYTHGMSSSSVPSALMMEHPLLNGEHPENPTAALIESLNEVTAPGDEPGEDAESTSGANAVAIDNKIEQAMDLVKSHLMYAVREEVEVLKEKIAELMERIGQLEAENATLRAGATPETLAMLPPPSQTTTTNP